MLVISGCEKAGRTPTSPPPAPEAQFGGFAGTVSFRNWPLRDSVKDLRVFALRSLPTKALLSQVLSGNVVIYPPSTSLPYNVDSQPYATYASTTTFVYVGVAQRFGQDLTADWRIVGVYDDNGDRTRPLPITVPTADTLRHIDISVDFQNLPPQPQ